MIKMAQLFCLFVCLIITGRHFEHTSDLNNSYFTLTFTLLQYDQFVYSKKILFLISAHLVVVIFVSHRFELLHHIFHHRLAHFFKLTGFKSLHSFLSLCYHFQSFRDLRVIQIPVWSPSSVKLIVFCSRKSCVLQRSAQSCFIISHLTIRSIVRTWRFLVCFLSIPEFHANNANSIVNFNNSDPWASISNPFVSCKTCINTTGIARALVPVIVMRLSNLEGNLSFFLLYNFDTIVA